MRRLTDLDLDALPAVGKVADVPALVLRTATALPHLLPAGVRRTTSRRSCVDAARAGSEGVRGHLPRPSACGVPRGELKERYDVVIIGGGSHGLATAYYLAKNHGITNVAVLEKSYIGSGAAGRNTTIIRSNYRTPEGARVLPAERRSSTRGSAPSSTSTSCSRSRAT